MPSPIQAVTFDAAGTLFHLAEPVGKTYARFARRHGHDLASDAIERAFHQAWRLAEAPHGVTASQAENPDDAEKSWWHRLVAETFRLAGSSPSGSDALFEALFAHFGKAEAWQLYPETLPVLDSLAGRLPLAIISNFDRRFHSVSAGLGIAGYFSQVLLSGEIGAAKPSPRLFSAAREALNCAPEAIFHVGDDPIADWQGARNAGFQVFELSRPANSLQDLPPALMALSPGTFACAPSDHG